MWLKVLLIWLALQSSHTFFIICKEHRCYHGPIPKWVHAYCVHALHACQVFCLAGEKILEKQEKQYNIHCINGILTVI